jgi:hypothetical protein
MPHELAHIDWADDPLPFLAEETEADQGTRLRHLKDQARVLRSRLERELPVEAEIDAMLFQASQRDYFDHEDSYIAP